MSAAARAEARRKAILARGTDRLAKLTSSARGEDAPAYMHDDPPLPNISSNSRNFLGEDSGNMPAPNRSTPSPSPSPQPNRTAASPSRNPFEPAGLGLGTMPDPSVWSPEQQQQFMQALMGAAPGGPTLPPSPFGDPSIPIDPSLPPMDNPLAAMLFPQQADGSFAPGKAAAPVKEQTRLQRLMPLLHLLSMWCLLAYFVLWVEPKVHDETSGSFAGVSLWQRWAELGRGRPGDAIRSFKVNVVPFFWALTTLQIALHSMRIFSGFDAVRPPTLLALALPHIPPPFPSIIVNALKYWQMGSLFLDDIAGIVVGLGFIIYFSGWFAA